MSGFSSVQSYRYLPNVQYQNSNSNSNQNVKTNSQQSSKMSTGTKVAIGAGLAALAAVGIYLATKGRCGKAVVTDAKKEISSLTNSCKWYKGCFTEKPNIAQKVEEQIEQKLAEISKLSETEQIKALKGLRTDLEYADIVVQHLDCDGLLPKGMKKLPDNVKQAYDKKDILKAGELLKQHLYKISDVRPALNKGKTVLETIENTFGKNSKIEPHTYDLSKESPVIHVYRNAGGYKDGIIGKEGRYWNKFTNIPDNGTVFGASSHSFKSIEEGKGLFVSSGSASELGVQGSKRKVVHLKLETEELDTAGRKIPYKITVLSPNSQYTPLQKDLLKFAEHPEKFDKEVINKITEVVPSGSKGFDAMISGDFYQNFDYDLFLSAIQSMAKKI